MASKSNAKKTSVKTKAQTKSSKKPVAKKTAVKKPVAKKAAPVKKPVAKTVTKKAPAKIAAKKIMVIKAPVKPAPVPAKPAAKTVDVRHTLDRAPSFKNKASMNTVARTHPGKAPITVVANAKRSGFTVGEYVVYPTHGVGKILGHEVEKIGEYELKVFVIAFEKDKMTLRVPVGRAEAAGLRGISPNDQITKALSTLKGRAKIARGMWSRRAQEYEAKINSGNLVSIAEVVRDLHKNVDQSERSYSERMIYETAMHRLCGEVAASERVDIKDAQDRLLKVLRKQAAANAAAAAA